MKQWDIFLFPHPNPAEPHPVVVVSNNGICTNPQLQFVNVLACQTVRPPNRTPKSNEVYLDHADGLDYKTLVKCDFMLQIEKSHLREKRGEVCSQRISAIRNQIQRFF